MPSERLRQGKRLQALEAMLSRLIRAIPISVRRMVTPRYRPELHYMRGFGPASAARQAQS